MAKKRVQIRRSPADLQTVGHWPGYICLGSPTYPFNFQTGKTWEEAIRRYRAEYPEESESLLFPDLEGNFPPEGSDDAE